MMKQALLWLIALVLPLLLNACASQEQAVERPPLTLCYGQDDTPAVDAALRMASLDSRHTLQLSGERCLLHSPIVLSGGVSLAGNDVEVRASRPMESLLIVDSNITGIAIGKIMLNGQGMSRYGVMVRRLNHWNPDWWDEESD